MTISIAKILKSTIFVLIFPIFISCKEKTMPFHGKVYKIENAAFGYEILYKGKIFIRQETIPVLQENKKFSDSLDAVKTLHLVIKKLNAGKKPTLSLQEIKQLKLKMSN